MKLYDELVWRGLIMDKTNNDIEKKLNNGGLTFYIGTDPTADSLHIGHLSSFLICKRLKDAGHNPIILIGGATGLIGDPKPNSERPMITKEEVDHNFNALKEQITSLFNCEVVNNYEWIKDINIMEFLRDYGKYFSVNYMLSKDIVARRLETGITYCEFSYMLLQALDFMYLYKNKNVKMQVCGQDQWGNVTSGIELIRKKLNKEAYAFTMPLVTTANGKKFGKSEGNAVWLDKNKTTPYELYQFFINVEDIMVPNYLKVFTFFSKEETEKIIEENNKYPEKRIGAKILAYEVVKFVHGEVEANKAKKTSEEIFEKGSMNNLPVIKLNNSALNNNLSLLDLLVNTKLVSSKSEARRLIDQNGISINNKKNFNNTKIITTNDLENNSLVIAKGKKIFIRVNFE